MTNCQKCRNNPFSTLLGLCVKLMKREFDVCMLKKWYYWDTAAATDWWDAMQKNMKVDERGAKSGGCNWRSQNCGRMHTRSLTGPQKNCSGDYRSDWVLCLKDARKTSMMAGGENFMRWKKRGRQVEQESRCGVVDKSVAGEAEKFCLSWDSRVRCGRVEFVCECELRLESVLRRDYVQRMRTLGEMGENSKTKFLKRCWREGPKVLWCGGDELNEFIYREVARDVCGEREQMWGVAFFFECNFLGLAMEREVLWTRGGLRSCLIFF